MSVVKLFKIRHHVPRLKDFVLKIFLILSVIEIGAIIGQDSTSQSVLHFGSDEFSHIFPYDISLPPSSEIEPFLNFHSQKLNNTSSSKKHAKFHAENYSTNNYYQNNSLIHSPKTSNFFENENTNNKKVRKIAQKNYASKNRNSIKTLSNLTNYEDSNDELSYKSAKFSKNVTVVGRVKSKNVKNKRGRRSVVHLYDMVVCATGCNPLAYKGYGCYCGFLGSGITVDGIDRCCAKHDWCYNHAKCPPLLTYFVPYYWTCNDGRPQCVSDYNGWRGVCGAHLCECDRQFAECLRKFPCPRSRAMCLTSPFRYAPEPETVYYFP